MELAYSYIRFSSLEQAKGDSFRRQTVLAKDYCEKHGLQLADLTLKDLGKSAYKGTHIKDGALGEFINTVKSGTIPKGSYLLVESMDRLSREKISIALGRFMELLGLGINIVTLQDSRTYTPESLDRIEDLMLSLVFMMRAHEESLTKSKRLKAAHKEKRKQARESLKPTGYNTPHWLQLTDSGYELIPERVAVLKRIFQMTIDGLGAIAIHRQLNQEGLKPWGRSKTGWHVTYIKKLLRARTTLGEYQPFKSVDGVREKDGEPIIGYYPAAIDAITFQRAALAIESRRGHQTGTRKKHVNNLFTGLLVCKNCGASMHYVNKGSGSKGGQYLVCSRARQGAHHDGVSCKYASMRYQIVEEAILTVAATLNLKLTPPENKEELEELQVQLSSVVTKLEAIKGDINRLVDAIAKLSDSNALLVKLSTLEQQQELLKQECRKIKKRINELEFTPSKHNVWKELSKTIKLLRTDAADRANVELRAKISSQLTNSIEEIKCEATAKTLSLYIEGTSYVDIVFDSKQKSFVVSPSWDTRSFLPSTFLVKETVRVHSSNTKLR